METLDQLPPQSKESEQGVLGSLLRDGGPFCEVIYSTLGVEDFYFHAHREIYRILAEAFAAGKPITDIGILFNELKNRKQLENVGGAVYLGEIIDAIPTGAYAEYHAEVVRSKSLARAAIHDATVFIRDLHYGREPTREVIARYEANLFANSGERSHRGDPIALSDAMEKAVQEIIDRNKPSGKKPIPTGFDELDKAVGGWRGGEFILIGARPSIGKTALATSLMISASRSKISTLFFSIEMSDIEVAYRAMSMDCEIPLNELRGNLEANEHNVRRLRQTKERHVGLPAWIDNREHNIASLTSVARRCVKKYNVGLIMIDYLQLLDHGPGRDQHVRVGETSRRLKLLAKSLDVPIICLAQLNRENENRPGGRPRLSDFRESGNLEQDADVAILLWPEAFDADRDPAAVQKIRLCIDKQRNGPKTIVDLDYRRAVTRFESGGIPL